MYYSGKQKAHTIRNVLVIDETTHIHFLSKTYEGRAHDKRIADEAGYDLPKGSVLYQDAGFQGFSPDGVCSMQPKKKPKGGVLTDEDKARNRAISSKRVLIEHVIGHIKRYRIVRDIIRSPYDWFRDKVMETCCGLHNFIVMFKRRSKTCDKT